MVSAEEDILSRVAVEITRRAVDNGQLIAAGFASFLAASYPEWRDMSTEQLDQLHSTFHAGAQHLFGSITSMLMEGDEPTVEDIARLDKIDDELRTFITDYKRRHGITEN